MIKIKILMNECLFRGFIGNESERGTKKSCEPQSGSKKILFVLRSDSFPMNPEIKTFIPHNIYNVSNKDPF